MNKIKRLQKVMKKVTSSPENARKFLQEAGIMTRKGKLSLKYR